ncbi:TPA: hypothetical protein ACGOTE_002068 [Streptococcus suis]
MRIKNYLKKHKNLIILVAAVGVSVILLIFLDYTNCFRKFLHLSVEFWSAMVGAVVTIVGVGWTLKVESEKSQTELRESVKPVFNITTDFDKMYNGKRDDHTIEIVTRDISKNIYIKVTNEFDLWNSESNYSCEDFVIIKLRNIGLGHGIIDRLGIVFNEKGNEELNEVELRPNFAIDKETSNIIKLNFPVNISEVKNIEFFFSDIIGNRYKYSVNFIDVKYKVKFFSYEKPKRDGLKQIKYFDKLSFETYLPILIKKN